MRVYTVSFSAVSVTAAQDFFELVPAANRGIEIIYAQVTQSSEEDPTTEEFLRCVWRIAYATSGSGGTAPTPVKKSPGDAAAVTTAEVNNTTLASTGTPLDVGGPESWNIRQGYYHVPVPEARIRCSAAETRLVLRLLAAPDDAITLDGECCFAELF